MIPIPPLVFHVARAVGKLKYDDLENIKTDRVNTVVLTHMKSNSQIFFWDTRYDTQFA